MPNLKIPNDLKTISKLSILNNIEKHWLKYKQSAQITKTIDDPESNFSKFRYILSPFEILDDDIIDFLLKILHKKNNLNKSYFCLLFHGRLKRADLSFIKKKSFFNPVICNYIGNNCINLVELDFHALYDIHPKYFCIMLYSMKNLKKLNLSHTKANRDVTKLISTNCKKLEILDLENCKSIYDDCIEDICDGIGKTIQYLNIDNIYISTEIIEKVLNTCTNLKFLYASELIKKLFEIQKSKENLDENQNIIKQYKLDTFYIDADVNLKAENMQVLSYTCPNLKHLRINCIGTNQSLNYLNTFNHLTELILANNSSLFTYNFGDYLLESIKGTIGKNLKSLHLIHLVDVNLRCIAKYCTNLIKLNIEFIGYYEPFDDKSIKENEKFTIKTLRNLSISNLSPKYEQIHLNIGQFKKDLVAILSNGKIKSLNLSSLNELDDEFFQSLFSIPVSRTMGSELKHVFDSIEELELKQMNEISSNLIIDYLINNPENRLKQINLNGCKNISKADFNLMNKLKSHKNFDLDLKWC